MNGWLDLYLDFLVCVSVLLICLYYLLAYVEKIFVYTARLFCLIVKCVAYLNLYFHWIYLF